MLAGPLDSSQLPGVLSVGGELVMAHTLPPQ